MTIKKIILSVVSLIFVAGFGYLIYAGSDSPDFKVINYYLPEEFEGCAIVLYDQEGGEPLMISEDKEMDIVFDENGFFKTSSPHNFGWQYEENSGYHDTNYYVGGQLLDSEEIHERHSGGLEGEDGKEIYYEGFSVKVANACKDNIVMDIVHKNMED